MTPGDLRVSCIGGQCDVFASAGHLVAACYASGGMTAEEVAHALVLGLRVRDELLPHVGGDRERLAGMVADVLAAWAADDA